MLFSELVQFHIHNGAISPEKLVTLRMMSTTLPAYVMTVMVGHFGKRQFHEMAPLIMTWFLKAMSLKEIHFFDKKTTRLPIK